MDSNLTLSIGFKGQIDVKAQAVPLQEGYLKLGGIIDSGASAAVPFGVVLSAETDTPDIFYAGLTDGDIVRGVAVWDDAIAQNAPAHPNAYLPGLPCAAIAHGFFFIKGWTKAATGAIDPVIGSVVIFNKADGKIEFLAAGSSAPSGYAILAGATVKDVDADNGALIYLS